MELVDVTSVAGLKAVEELLHEVWYAPGAHPPVPHDLLCAFHHLGGQVGGAYLDGILVGASVAIPTSEPDLLYSIVAAVSREHAGQGIGLRLKLHQRDAALAAGRTRIRWTFDPLLRANARFNLVRLGARGVDYAEDFFGVMTDAFNSGAPSDRLVVDWDLSASGDAGVVDSPAGDPIADGPDGVCAVRRDGARTWVRIPDDIVADRREDPTRALAWTELFRSQVGGPLAASSTLVGLSADGWYLLEES